MPHPSGRLPLVLTIRLWQCRGMTAQHGAPEGQQTLGALVHQLTQQIPDLIRSEVKLAQAEVTEKGKRAGVGIGIFSVAGLLAFFGVATLVVTAVLALALVLDAWLAALVIALLLLAAAGVAAVVAKNKVQEAGPPVPERAIEGVKEDIATVKGQHHE